MQKVSGAGRETPARVTVFFGLTSHPVMVPNCVLTPDEMLPRPLQVQQVPLGNQVLLGMDRLVRDLSLP